MGNDEFGRLIKEKELSYAGQTIKEDIIAVRLDGKAFHTLTRHYPRPYCTAFSDIMVQTMNHLLQKTNAVLGYTQSDEISLIYYKEAEYQQFEFNKRIQKLTSVYASMATAIFNDLLRANKELYSISTGEYAYFDCRVWGLDSRSEAADILTWRQQDAVKNAVSMAAHSLFTNKELHKKKTGEMKDMLLKKFGIDFNQYPDFFKFGTYSSKEYHEVPIDLDDGSTGFDYLKAVGQTCQRTKIVNYSLPDLMIEIDKEKTLFNKADNYLEDKKRFTKEKKGNKNV